MCTYMRFPAGLSAAGILLWFNTLGTICYFPLFWCMVMYDKI